MINSFATPNCQTIQFRFINDCSTFSFTGVYGPSSYVGRQHFFDQLTAAKLLVNEPGMVAGDFNVTLTTDDRSSPTADWRESLRFKQSIDSSSIGDLQLHGRKYTWCVWTDF